MSDTTSYRSSWQELSKKLDRVLGERIAADTWDWNHDRYGAEVTWSKDGRFYRMDQTIERAHGNGQKKVKTSKDCFAQLVYGLEDQARGLERGIYSAAQGFAGFEALPPAPPIPECLKALGFTQMPDSVEEVKVRRRAVILQHHPDKGGDAHVFQRLLSAAEEAEALVAAFHAATPQ